MNIFRFTSKLSQPIIIVNSLLLIFASATAWGGTIVGSVHDFSAALPTQTEGQICVACHTPHNADISVTEAPLWNHEVTIATYTLYTSPTLDATPGQPTGSSKLCLSCHDGTVAIDSFGGATGNVFMTGDQAVGRNGELSDDHPISITFDDTLASTDGGLFPPSTTNVTIGDPADRTKTGTIDTTMLIGGQVQCASCHDVHNNFVAAATTGSAFLLKVSKDSSAICLTCHNK